MAVDNTSYVSFKKQQQSQMKMYSSGKLPPHHASDFGSGLSKLAVVIFAACACSFFYIALLAFSNVACGSSIHSSSSTSATFVRRFSLAANATAPPESDRSNNAFSNSSSSDNAQKTNETSSSETSSSMGRIGRNLALPVVAEAEAQGTSLGNIVFGIAASSRLWERRREYVRLWWRATQMRGIVWLDKKPRRRWSSADYPPYRVSASTAGFNYTNKMGSRSAIRISRIVSETFRIGLPDVHWFVMGDDDTVFVPENLVKVLSKYDHRKFYYIGSSSESHTQNLHFSYNMAYGGGGFAISYPLAKALEKMQDSCLHRYPYLFGSDDRIQACMAELGVPLVKEPGFHQFDIYGDASGLLSAHPVTPLISIHHLDVISPIFPNMTQVQGLKHLRKSMRVDASGVLQQSICYDKWRKWSFSVSWGYAVQVYRGILPARELELPARTFISWYRRTEDSGFPFSTRGVSGNPCEQPTVFYMGNVGMKSPQQSVSIYMRETKRRGDCRWKMASPAGIDWIRVHKEKTDKNWHQAPRRQCCRVLNSNKKNVEIEVGECRFGEYIA